MKTKFHIMKVYGIAVIVAVLSTPALRAQVTLSIDSLQGSVSVQNEISTENSVELPVTIAHNGDATDWFVTVSRGGSSTFDPRQARVRVKGTWFTTDYNVFTPDNEIARDLTGPISSNEVLSGSFSASAEGQTQTSSFTVRIPAGQYVLAETYEDDVDVTLYRGSVADPANAVQEEQRVVTILPDTFIVVEAGVVPPGGTPGSRTESYEMDFGELTPGDSRSADLIFRANTSYEVAVSSRHDGEMFLYPNDAPDSTPDLEAAPIPYEFIYDGKSSAIPRNNLEKVNKVTDPSFPYERRTIEVVIGDFADLRAGTYRDVISLTVSAF
ncbi:MAG: hypothetical protein WD492_07975 [Alkalispirochaeta sp.]